MRTGGVVTVIPAYEPSDRLVGLVAKLAMGDGSVVVVDDGSGQRYASIFEAVAAVPGAQVLRHPTNRGKGASLRTGLAHALEMPECAVGVVTADADGQHTVVDIEQVAAELARQCRDAAQIVILGERDFDLPGIPLRSRFGNKVTTAVLWLLLGRRLPDTQTGLRGFSTDLLPELLAVPGDRFDHEMRALVHLVCSGSRVVQVPIETVYEDGQNATSHFRPLRDSAVIYATLLRQLAAFLLSSVAGFFVDILVFVAVVDTVFDGHPTIRAVGAATVVARIASALTNYAVNRAVVFRSRRTIPRSLGRYSLLAVLIVTASWILTTGLSHVLGDHVVWAKLVVDSTLFVVSYLAQRRWVFADVGAPRAGGAAHSGLVHGARAR